MKSQTKRSLLILVFQFPTLGYNNAALGTNIVSFLEAFHEK